MDHILNPGNYLVIETITAFVTVDKDGNEGVIGQMLDGVFMPFVCADEARVKSMFPLAEKLVRDNPQLGMTYKVLRFSTRTDITEETKKKYSAQNT